jgi:hypothetical protein
MPGPRGVERYVSLLAILLAQPVQPWAVPGLPEKETLNYRVEWRLIAAGKARLTWDPSPQSSDPGWQLNLHLESTGMVSKLFLVNDDYSALLQADLCTSSSQIRAHEGRRQRESKVTYDREGRKASYLERDLVKNVVVNSHEIDIPGCVHDVIGGLYYLRTLNLQTGQSVQIPVSDGKKSLLARIEAQQREEVKIRSAVYKTIRYEAFLFNKVLYNRSGRLHVWLTDDPRKLPVQIRVRLQFTIGTITLQLDKEEKT